MYKMQNFFAKREREREKSIGEAVAGLWNLVLIDCASRARQVPHLHFMQYLLDPLSVSPHAVSHIYIYI